jgi:general secretion pathway protein A
MYTSWFGLKENPFSLSPDPRYLYLSPQHRDAMNCLIYGITEKKGFTVITGGIGTGKTTICRSLLATLDESVETALIFNSFLSDLELLETINQEFGLPAEGAEKSKKRYIDALNTFLMDNFARGKNAVLMIDEAQNLSHSVLEQIRMLSNLETTREKLIQIVLVGQPELQEILALPSLRQLSERITVRYDLNPLDEKEVRHYIEYRLTVAGGKDLIRFTRGAMRMIWRFSEGIPRRINAIADRALLIGYTRGNPVVDRKMVKNAVKDIGENYLIKVGRADRIKKSWRRLLKSYCLTK